MNVIGLLGPTGSGKSHRALLVAHERSIDLVVDDGLLIENNHIVAGVSSKRQSTKIGAIKTALFTNEEHASEVRDKIAAVKPESILVLGTSRGMLIKICSRLGIPEPAEIISITDIASPQEIQRARRIRTQLGKHVVPAPTVEVKSRFSGLLVDPLPTLFKRKSTSERQKQFMVDQTVVQPTFNFYGSFFISSTAIDHILAAGAKQIEGVKDIYHIRTRTISEGIEISFHMTALFGYNLPDLVRSTKTAVVEALEHMTSLHVLEVNILIKRLAMTGDEKDDAAD